MACFNISDVADVVDNLEALYDDNWSAPRSESGDSRCPASLALFSGEHVEIIDTFIDKFMTPSIPPLCGLEFRSRWEERFHHRVDLEIGLDELGVDRFDYQVGAGEVLDSSLEVLFDKMPARGPFDNAAEDGADLSSLSPSIVEAAMTEDAAVGSMLGSTVVLPKRRRRRVKRPG